MRLKSSILLLLIFLNFTGIAQNFTWMRGSQYGGAFSVYGSQQTSSSLNDPGGRHGSGTWTDTLGNLWLFGGEGYWNNTTNLYRYNDLWKYTPLTNEWTWINGSNTTNPLASYGTHGVPSSTNTPGGRDDVATWVDSDGNFYLFGGFGYGSTSSPGFLSDLWKYNPYTNEWTWLKGSNITDQNGVYGVQNNPSLSSHPGGRFSPSTWTDTAGDLWLFGGRGYPAIGSPSFLNDLWRYNIATNTWTWMHGTNTGAQQGIYGTLMTPNSSNCPGSRHASSSWTAKDGKLYLFGGTGYATSSFLGYMNDLWRYDPMNNTWTWIKGTDLINQFGVYGTFQVPSLLNVPGGRDNAVAWTDQSGDIWLFGGDGYELVGVCDRLNDLFKYDVSNNQWIWMKGANFHNQNGIYGAQGLATPNNIPGARNNTIYWNTGTPKKSLWLFGAWALDDTATISYQMNDLWKFELPCNPDSLNNLGTTNICSGDSANLLAFNQFPATTSWYSTSTSSVAIATATNFNTSSLTALTTQSVYTFYAESNSCILSPRVSISITVNPIPTLSVTISSTLLCKGNSATLTVFGASTYSWTNLGTNSVQIVSPASNTTYSVVGTLTTGCTGKTQRILQVNECLSIKDNSENASISAYPNPNDGTFVIQIPEDFAALRLVITDIVGRTVLQQEVHTGINEIRLKDQRGLLFVRIFTENQILTTKLLIN